MKLHVEAVRRRARRLRDAVALLEAEYELVAEVLRHVELVETERQRRGLLAGDEQESGLDVVPPPELVALAQQELPVLTGSDPVLDRGRVDGEVVVDPDLDVLVGAFLGRVPRLYVQHRHALGLPGVRQGQT